MLKLPASHPLRHTQHRESTILAPDMAFRFPKQTDSGISFEALAPPKHTAIQILHVDKKIFKLDYFFSIYLIHKNLPS